LSLRIQGILFAILSAIFYGTNPLGAIFLYEEGLNVNSIIFYRFLFASIILFIFLLYKKESLKVNFKELLLLSLLGFLFGVSAIALFSSFLYIDVGVASTILFIYPIFVAILMAIFFKEKTTIVDISSIFFAFLGVIFLYASKEASISNIGILLVILSSICYAIYIVLINQYLKISALLITFYSILFCTLTIFINSNFSQSLEIMPLLNFNMWFFTIFLAIVPTIASLLLLVEAIQIIGSTNASILGALEPLTAVIIGIVVFKEQLTIFLVIGIILIIFGVSLIIFKNSILKHIKKRD